MNSLQVLLTFTQHLMVIYCRNSDLSSQTPQICSKTTYDTATVPPVAGSSHNQPHIVILINTASTTLHWLRKPPHTAPPFAGSSSRNTTTVCWRRFPTMACGGWLRMKVEQIWTQSERS
ncbi:hypothetical protein GLYMA_19G195000v4 [Glycine max]|uniref:Uncharacterized protein n=1 Tax=Glycine max TaxID=3847 RepID=A0A0R0EZ13_SOYBN|nr:hypothetical protein GYH30_053600 [Glycine max]KRG96199.1 hypothetical protein GLYMA_19G195000v4 [Glycine max]